MPAKISKYRTAIMGVAILWIMAYHSGISFPLHIPVLSPVASYVRSTGYGAVDIFMFLSGFGLYMSLSRNPDCLTFYKKRVFRILPTYLPVLTVWLLLNLPAIPEDAWRHALLQNLITVLNNLTGAAFWLSKPPSFNWYMPAMIAFYLLTPVLFSLMGTRRRETGLLLFTLLLDISFLDDYALVAVSRLTVFVLGMIAGRCLSEKREIRWKVELTAYLSGIISYIALYCFREKMPLLLWSKGLHWYSFIFVAPALIFLLCRLFSLLDTSTAGHRICLAFEKTGLLTLEIYLIHIVLFDYLHIESGFLWIPVFVLMIACGWLYQKAIAAVTARIARK